MGNFKELKVWQKARALARDVYAATRSFPRQEIFGLTQQMRRAAISIVSNIAEGHARYTHGEYASFVVIARGSTAELEAQLIVAHDLNYIDETTADSLTSQAEEISKMLSAILRYLRG